MVIYSTCSLEPEENDVVVEELLRGRSDFVRGDVAKFVNANVARWVEDGVLRLTPEAGTDGFTAQVLFRVILTASAASLSGSPVGQR
jgi:16S rRNA C967 or C1407 C5-methylase (RsmB/RsmF family)